MSAELHTSTKNCDQKLFELWTKSDSLRRQVNLMISQIEGPDDEKRVEEAHLHRMDLLREISSTTACTPTGIVIKLLVALESVQQETAHPVTLSAVVTSLLSAIAIAGENLPGELRALIREHIQAPEHGITKHYLR